MGGERDAGPLEGRQEKQTHWALTRVTGPGFAGDGPVSSEGGNLGATTEKVPGELTDLSPPPQPPVTSRERLNPAVLVIRPPPLSHRCVRQ